MTIRVATSAWRRVRHYGDGGCSDGLLGLLVNTDVRSMEGVTLCFTPMKKWRRIRHRKLSQSSVMKMSIDGFLLCGFFFLFFLSVFFFYFWSHKINTMALGDKLDKESWLLFDPHAGNALLIQSAHKQLRWSSWYYPRKVFSHIVMFIFLFKSKILLFRATGVQCESSQMHCFHIVSE